MKAAVFVTTLASISAWHLPSIPIRQHSISLGVINEPKANEGAPKGTTPARLGSDVADLEHSSPDPAGASPLNIQSRGVDKTFQSQSFTCDPGPTAEVAGKQGERG